MFSELDLLLRWPDVARHVAAPLDAPPVLVDVGAHTGLLTAEAGARGWRVVAFEPEPGNRAELLETVAGMPQVTVIPRAVSDVSGQIVPFYVSAVHPGIHTLKPFHPTHEAALEVETVRLDEALADLDIDRVDLLKIDIEGADFLALKGFDFTRWQPQIITCEFMDSRSVPNFAYTHHDMAAYMQARGYTVWTAAWAPITEYAQPGVTPQHRFLHCTPYDPAESPAWGNFFGVRADCEAVFAAALAEELRATRQRARRKQVARLRRTLRRVPGVYPLYRLLRGKPKA